MKMEIFCTKLESQQHQHKARNIHHKDGISTKLAQSWKYSTQGWNLNNIITKMEIFNTSLESQQHQHEAGNFQ
jgi:hypothetical protein